MSAMLFNVFLGNQPAERLKTLADLVDPIRHGLAEGGHHVISYGLGLLPAPAVNLLVEFFPDDAFTATLLKMKAEAGERLAIGLVCPDDAEDDVALGLAGHPRRRDNLRRVAAAVDFVWTLLPQVPFYEGLNGPGRTAHVTFGFSERLVNRRLVTAPGLRDIDVLVEGEETPYRHDIVAKLRSAGLKCVVSGTRPLPGFARNDLARRAKLVLDARAHPAARFSSPRGICRSLHNGALTVSERSAGQPDAGLDRFTAGCEPAMLVDYCVGTIRSGRAVELGLAALTKFRTETSMRDALAHALRLPVVQRLVS